MRITRPLIRDAPRKQVVEYPACQPITLSHPSISKPSISTDMCWRLSGGWPKNTCNIAQELGHRWRRQHRNPVVLSARRGSPEEVNSCSNGVSQGGAHRSQFRKNRKYARCPDPDKEEPPHSSRRTTTDSLAVSTIPANRDRKLEGTNFCSG